MVYFFCSFMTILLFGAALSMYQIWGSYKKLAERPLTWRETTFLGAVSGIAFTGILATIIKMWLLVLGT